MQNVRLYLQEILLPENNEGRYETLQVYDMLQEVWFCRLAQETHGKQQAQSVC